MHVTPLRPDAVSQAPALAALPMYDLPELQAANDALWAGLVDELAKEGVEAPRALTRDRDLHALWRDPTLLLAHACGYPLVTGLGNSVQLVATPRYRAQGCTGPFHRSAIVVRTDAAYDRLAELRGARCAVNERSSNTGMNLLRAEVARVAERRRFFAEVRFTGAHVASLTAIVEGQADVAAVDAVTLAHLQRLRPAFAESLRVLQWTQASPGLPLITSRSTPAAGVEALRRALQQVAVCPRLADVREALLLDGFNVLKAPYYGVIRHLEDGAAERGYPELV